MAPTKHFNDLVRSRVERDPEFRAALLSEALESMLAGDMDTGKALLRDYINATVGFQELGEATGSLPKGLMRMFGPNGNPQAKNLFAVLARLQQQGCFRIQIKATPITLKELLLSKSARFELPIPERGSARRRRISALR